MFRPYKAILWQLLIDWFNDILINLNVIVMTF
jgi:hypothetical protein